MLSFSRTIFIAIIALVLSPNVNATNPNPLSTEQKVADFDSLYFQLKGAFPYFEVNKRLNQVDWLGNYEAYKTRISQTQNNKQYLAEIDAIMDELNCGHADLLPTVYYNYMFTRYRMISWTHKSYKRHLQELKKNDAKQKNQYWAHIYQELHPSKKSKKTTENTEATANLTFEIFEAQSLAVMHIKSFSYEHVKADKKALLKFYENLNNYENLIIDIQGNGGGDTRYWQQNIVPYISNTTLNYSSYTAFKDNAEFYNFAGQLEGMPIDSVPLYNMPEELYEDDYLFKKSSWSLHPNKKSIHYRGKIYVLADHNVYSSSEAFANFCINTGFAKVVGETTGGDGVGSDPFLFTLPHSGIVIRYPGIMGLNADGSSNEEIGTIPSIEIEGNTCEERFTNFIKTIDG
ncbi:S41 family peptidase [Saccharicrinis aurantiacus]|uniref:S41 family peptidase n=1 Tax=Saccharicrinis aurantiacus TaxID=1849719 RepID=UPI00249167DF|nr:S41 family peptidase [Saccharicrinis aurantiacus]